MLTETLGAARDIGRLNTILGVLIRHGFGDMVHRLGLTEARSHSCNITISERSGSRHWKEQQPGNQCRVATFLLEVETLHEDQAVESRHSYQRNS